MTTPEMIEYVFFIRFIQSIFLAFSSNTIGYLSILGFGRVFVTIFSGFMLIKDNVEVSAGE
ncbi:MAG: hypothetical protein GX444_19125 [Myxococcales bacterium]|nr:hypothetical protein [Myxococcales bacterium]